MGVRMSGTRNDAPVPIHESSTQGSTIDVTPGVESHERGDRDDREIAVTPRELDERVALPAACRERDAREELVRRKAVRQVARRKL